MAEEFKLIDGAYRIGSDQKEALKSFILDRMRKINNRTKTGKLSKTGTETKTYIDGEEFVFKSQGGDKWSWRNKGGLRAGDQKRKESIDTQTHGKKDLPKTPSKALEVHHQRMVALYSPLYEGLSEAEGLELSRYFAEDLNMPLGDKLANASTLPMKPHDDIHEFIDHEFRGKGKLPDWSDPKYNKLQLPDGEILEGLDARKFHAKNFFSEIVQPVIDEKTMGLMQGFAEGNPKGYKGLYKNHLLKDVVGSITRNAGKFTKVASGAGTAESAALIASGQVIPGSIGLAMQTPVVQKQAAKLLAKQGLKLIPGVSLGSGLLQAGGYLMAGQYGKAALSTVGGVAGEFGPAGDAVQAMIDLGLTVDDIKTTKVKKAKKTNVDIDLPNKQALKSISKAL